MILEPAYLHEPCRPIGWEWEARFAVDYAIASVEQAKFAVLDAIDGPLGSRRSQASVARIEVFGATVRFRNLRAKKPRRSGRG
jgi:hypothetical protein